MQGVVEPRGPVSDLGAVVLVGAAMEAHVGMLVVAGPMDPVGLVRQRMASALLLPRFPRLPRYQKLQ